MCNSAPIWPLLGVPSRTGDEVHVPGTGTIAEDMWAEAVSAMIKLWDQHNPKEIVPGPEPSSQNLRKQ